MYKLIVLTISIASFAFCANDSTEISILHTMGFRNIISNNGSAPRDMQIKLLCNARIFNDCIKISESDYIGEIKKRDVNFLGLTDTIKRSYLCEKKLDKNLYLILFTKKNIFILTNTAGSISSKGRYFLVVLSIPSGKMSRRFIIK